MVSESVIKWQTGAPNETGEYIVTTWDGLVDYDVAYRHRDGYLFWGFYNIEPYKDE